MKVYTLKNCDTCKKALKWLEAEGIEYDNHDVRADGLDKATVEHIVSAAGWEKALNRRSTTWRKLGDSDKAGPDNTKTVNLVVEHPTLLKRPVFVSGNDVIIGFDRRAQEAVEILA